ncbi:MAG: sugar ABC transporter substrate-binding protein [Sedimentisphaerales bacterium]|jgi:ABC-type sugar transport system substrate-binding protein
MKTPGRSILVALLIAIAATSAGCSRRPEESGQLTICFAFQDLETEYWVAAHKAITETLRARNVEVLERNAHQDANRQLEQIRDAIAQDVDGIIMIPQDGESAVTITGEANRAGIPIGVFNRPPADRSHPALVVVAHNERIAKEAVTYMVKAARKLNRKMTPLILVGDLGDQNSVERKNGFYEAVNAQPDLFEKPIEVPTKWDAVTTLANLEAALQLEPGVDFIFTSSDFLYPQIKAVLEPLGKWKPIGDPDHVILGGLDGDSTAYNLMKEGYVDATGVQDLFFEADAIIQALLDAIEKGETKPEKWIQDPGFALTQENMAERQTDMWGYRILESAKTATPK